MPAGGALIGGVASIGSAIYGGQQAAAQQQLALQQRQKALEQYLAINVPDPAQQQLILQKYQMTGQLDPAMETAINQGASAQQGIALDPTTRAAQMSALSQLGDITSNQGMDAQQKSQIQQGINKANANEQGQRGAILQAEARRGLGGSGAGLAAQLESSQAGANRASDEAMSAQSMASQRALSALGQQGALAGSVHSQDYNQALNAANAQDAISNFNARNQNEAMRANTTAKNQAQAYNVQEGQNIANQNTGLSNYEQQFNKGLGQQQFNNQMNVAQGKANALGGLANQYNQQGQTQANMWGGISSGLATGAGTLYGSQRPKKTASEDDGEQDSNASEG